VGSQVCPIQHRRSLIGTNILTLQGFRSGFHLVSENLTHVSCFNALVLAFDFSVKGVTSISCDTHKFGFAPKVGIVISLHQAYYLFKMEVLLFSMFEI
jgi:hypothetical protein